MTELQVGKLLLDFALLFAITIPVLILSEAYKKLCRQGSRRNSEVLDGVSGNSEYRRQEENDSRVQLPIVPVGQVVKDLGK